MQDTLVLLDKSVHPKAERFSSVTGQAGHTRSESGVVGTDILPVHSITKTRGFSKSSNQARGFATNENHLCQFVSTLRQ